MLGYHKGGGHMNKKRIWFILPAALLPYLGILALAVIFFSTENPVFEFIMESIFNSNALDLIATLLLYCILATVLSIVCFAVSIRKRWDALSLAKSAMIMKLFQVPAYVLIFVLGVLFAFAIFTIPFAVGLFLLDCLTLFLTGLLTAAAVMNAVRQGVFKSKEVIWIILLQLVFCADVVASIVFYTTLRKRCKSKTSNT